MVCGLVSLKRSSSLGNGLILGATVFHILGPGDILKHKHSLVAGLLEQSTYRGIWGPEWLCEA